MSASRDEVSIPHFDLDLSVCFATKRMSGSITLQLRPRREDVCRVVLDAAHLCVASVLSVPDGRHLQFVNERHCLTVMDRVRLPQAVRVYYSTGPAPAARAAE